MESTKISIAFFSPALILTQNLNPLIALSVLVGVLGMRYISLFAPSSCPSHVSSKPSNAQIKTFQIDDLVQNILSYLSADELRDVITTNKIMKKNIGLLFNKESQRLLEQAQDCRYLPKDLKISELPPKDCDKIANHISRQNLLLLLNLQNAGHISAVKALRLYSRTNCQIEARKFQDESLVKAFSEILESLPLTTQSLWKGNHQDPSEIRDFLYENQDSLTKIDKLYLNFCGLKSVPPEIKLFTKLNHVNFRHNEISDINYLLELKHIKIIDLCYNKIANIEFSNYSKTLFITFIAKKQLYILRDGLGPTSTYPPPDSLWGELKFILI